MTQIQDAATLFSKATLLHPGLCNAKSQRIFFRGYPMSHDDDKLSYENGVIKKLEMTKFDLTLNDTACSYSLPQ